VAGYCAPGNRRVSDLAGSAAGAWPVTCNGERIQQRERSPITPQTACAVARLSPANG